MTPDVDEEAKSTLAIPEELEPDALDPQNAPEMPASPSSLRQQPEMRKLPTNWPELWK